MISGKRWPHPWRRLAVTGVAVGALAVGVIAGADGGAADVPPQAVPEAVCGPGAMPETSIQGRVPKSDFESGRAAEGYLCNTRTVSRFGRSGGFKVLRYTDSQGNTCAFYDSTLMIGLNVLGNLLNGTGLGVFVLDMNDPANPRKTANLTTPAMLSPHESLLVNKRRGLLAAVMGTAATAPGILDVYDVRTDCRHPKLLSSKPSTLFGHESGFSPDGRTFWSAGAAGFTLAAIDLTDPRRPRTVFSKAGVIYHGLRFSGDGNTMYVANIGTFNGNSVLDRPGLRIYDVSEVQARADDPDIELLADLTWPEASIPQVAQPFTRDGRQYVLEVDEFSDFVGDGFTVRGDGPVCAARIIDVDDPRHPFVVSHLRLAVHQADQRTDDVMSDPGAKTPIRGYTAHYCSVPRPHEPRIVGCSMVLSGLRLFDITDLEHPREVAYYNRPAKGGGFAMSQPAWDPSRNSVWYSDGVTGFHNVRLTNGVGRLLH